MNLRAYARTSDLQRKIVKVWINDHDIGCLYPHHTDADELVAYLNAYAESQLVDSAIATGTLAKAEEVAYQAEVDADETVDPPAAVTGDWRPVTGDVNCVCPADEPLVDDAVCDGARGMLLNVRAIIGELRREVQARAKMVLVREKELAVADDTIDTMRQSIDSLERQVVSLGLERHHLHSRRPTSMPADALAETQAAGLADVGKAMDSQTLCDTENRIAEEQEEERARLDLYSDEHHADTA